MSEFAKIFIGIGFLLIFMGLILLLFDKLPFFGKLPGDFEYRGTNIRVYFPFLSMLIVSLILTILLNIFFYFFRR
ncbi:Protein of unknown function (DUF2905) [Thermodesulfobium acidiphilum]|uniref:DUF2905 domain-containing protein n=1 Tax=Thermodesulfobium acidiphilum TaxID=1794699 RepID=A0A2R4VZL3_THEAF|nr:DUF2905 domain-containing protein [Thermodesulfobium acidiphilum]AWB09991.1 Protein of unknown function (DUF2905) [Thermodesulfobium acidiphilum]PMP86349.1 MAG: DUF2905 domain-containing protein [Thermodesulfobium narugense]